MSGSVKERIEQALSVLLGMPLWRSGRAADLQWFQFGERRLMEDDEGGAVEVGEYSLHVQCAWRICAPGRIVVASSDLYYPPGDPALASDEFDWDVPGGNRRDQRVASFLQEHAGAPLRVRSVEADDVGGARLSLTDGFFLELFPDRSLRDEHSEHWRLLRPAEDEPHFVVTGYGIEE